MADQGAIRREILIVRKLYLSETPDGGVELIEEVHGVPCRKCGANIPLVGRHRNHPYGRLCKTCHSDAKKAVWARKRAELAAERAR